MATGIIRRTPASILRQLLEKQRKERGPIEPSEIRRGAYTVEIMDKLLNSVR